MIIQCIVSALVATTVFHSDNPTGAINPSDGAKDIFSHRVEKVVDHVYLIYRPDAERVPVEGNVELIEQSDGLVVIDAGGNMRAGLDVVSNIKKLSPLPVKYLVYTHWHGDHNLGSPAIKAAFPAVRIISTVNTLKHLTDDSEHVKDLPKFEQASADGFAQYLLKPGLNQEVIDRLKQVISDTPSMVAAVANAHVALPSITFESKITLDDAQEPVELFFLGNANTDGDAIAWLPREKVLITGDVVVAPVPYGSESYPHEWISVLDRLMAMNPTYLIPGHGAVQGDQSYVKSLRQVLQNLVAQIDPLVAAGDSLEQVEKQVDFQKDVEVFAGQSKYRRSEFNGYFLNSMIKNTYLEAKGTPVQQGQPYL